MKKLYLCVVALCFAQVSATVFDENPNNFEEAIGSKDIFPVLPIVALWSNNDKCRNDSHTLLENLKNSTTWAMQMWDATAKGAVGAYVGNTYQMGDFDECVATVSPVRAQYCLATVTVDHRGVDALDLDIYNPHTSIWNKINYIGDPSKIRRDIIHWALCVPASCSHSDVEASVNRHLAVVAGNYSRASINVAVDAALCQTNRQEETLSAGAVIYCSVLVAIVFIVVLSTAYDFATRDMGDYGEEQCCDGKYNGFIGYFLCFSLRRNFCEIALPESSNHSLDCIYGMRFLSIFLITIDHRIGISIAGPIQNYEFIEKQYKQFHSIIFYQGDALVDTFFVISGLLVTYILLLTLDKKKVNPFLAILLRYVRLTPVYLIVIFFYSTMLYRMGDGPMWDLIVGPERDACSENWWVNALYANNYINDEKMCMIQSWYLPCDTHFFIIALFVVMIMHKRPTLGCSILGVLTFLSVLIPWAITFTQEKAPLLYFYSDFLISPRTHDVFRTIYTKSHTRASPYFVGMATGYLLYRTRSYKKNYTWSTTMGLIVSLCICALSLLPATWFYDYTWEYDKIQAALFAGLHRLAWAVGICMFMLSLIFSKRSMINAVLSWSPMISLSKLVYSQYLVHMAVQTVHSASFRTPQHMGVLNVGSLAIADCVWSLLLALCLYLTVEAPTRLIFKRIMDREKKPNADPIANEFRYTQKICIGM